MQLIHPHLRKSRYLRRRLHEHWARLDVQKKFPRFRIQAAIAGSVDIFENTSNIWDGLLEHSVPVGKFIYNQPDTTASDSDIERLGEDDAYNVAVMRSVMRRKEGSESIDVMQPLFACEADKNNYVNCLSEFASGEKGIKGLYFIEILFILARSYVKPSHSEDAPRSAITPPPAFTIMDMYLKHLSDPSVNRITELQPRIWSLLCSANLSSMTLIQHISEYCLEAADRPARDDIIQKCISGLMSSYDDKSFDADSFIIKTIDWLCTEKHLRVHSPAAITARALHTSRKNLLNYMLRHHSNVGQQEFLASLAP